MYGTSSIIEHKKEAGNRNTCSVSLQAVQLTVAVCSTVHKNHPPTA